MDILKKSYVRKSDPNSDIFTVDKIDNGFIIFTNGARCKPETLAADFAEYFMTNTNDELPELIPNADTFFNSPLGINPDNIINPDDSEKLKNSTSLGSLENDARYEKVGPGATNTNSGLSNLINNDTDEPVQQRIAREPEWDVFDNVKLAEEIEILVPFKIKLPRAEKIDVLNDMFKTSFTAYLAKKYITDNIINNSATLQMALKKGIEDWIESELYDGKKKKPIKKILKKNKEETVEPIIIPKPEVTETTASNLFGQVVNWDGDIKKLYVISIDEQYQAVKKKFIALKDANANPIEIDRLEGMLQIYEDELNNNAQN